MIVGMTAAKREIFPAVAIKTYEAVVASQIAGQKLRTLRLAAGFKTARKMAEALGINDNMYGRYERGETTPPYALLEKMAQLLRTTADRLLVDADQSESGSLHDTTPAVSTPRSGAPQERSRTKLPSPRSGFADSLADSVTGGSANSGSANHSILSTGTEEQIALSGSSAPSAHRIAFEADCWRLASELAKAGLHPDGWAHSGPTTGGPHLNRVTAELFLELQNNPFHTIARCFRSDGINTLTKASLRRLNNAINAVMLHVSSARTSSSG